MDPAVNRIEVPNVAAQRVERLQSLSFTAIAALPERQDESERVRGREIAVATYRDRLPDGRIRVVVQAYFHRLLGVGTMASKGFFIAPDNTRTPVPEKMMWELV